MQIYGLFDPRNGELRYVGFTSKSLQERLEKGHLSSTSLKKVSYKNSWIKSLLKVGLKPEIELLQETSEKDRDLDEQWNIAYFRSIGCRLTNLAAGGGGSIGYKHTPEAKQRIGEAARGNQFALGHKATIATKQKMSDTKKRLSLKPNPTPEQRLENTRITAEKLRGIPRPEYVKLKVSQSHFGIRPSEATKKKLSDFNKRFSQDQIDKIFYEYITKDISLSALAKQYSVVPSVMFNILHEVKYQCFDRNIAQQAEEKLEMRSRKKRIKQ